jgi:predicted acylesterase/phospholipase RssA
MNSQSTALAVLLSTALSACNLFSHTNIKQSDVVTEPSRATFNVTTDRGRDDTLMILAFSGGGSRAAYWSASFMLALQRVFASQQLDMLAHVDAISSVSGGSLPAAYYAISTDPETSAGYGRVWKESTVKNLMSQNYTGRWFGNWFWPTNIAKFWFTAFDRTDIMAQTLADNMYDTRPLGRDLRMRDLQPDRPYLVLNATNGTRNAFGDSFTFTAEDFASIDSDINDYELSRAVMGTATFPAVFNYMTLRNYQAAGDSAEYLHIFDGGNVDNLGLTGVSRILTTLAENNTHYDRLIIILVDAYTGKSGVGNNEADSRKFFDFIIDSNFLDATDSLLSANRKQRVADFRKTFEQRYADDPVLQSHSLFYHIKFEDISDKKHRDTLQDIPTNFTISPENTASIDWAIDRLMTPENVCLTALRDLLLDGSHNAEPVCTYSN